MNIDFLQGIISYPSSGSIQQFLQKTGSYVSISTANGHIDLAFSHGGTNYLVSESVDVSNAWGPLQANTNYWLYWDVNTTSAVLSYGFTQYAPIVSTSQPTNVEQTQHWFNLASKKMFVFEGAAWREVIRLFAAKINNSTFTPLGAGYPATPYAGSQVGLTVENSLVGRILSDNVGKPIRRLNGRFFTTEDDYFINGSPINTVRMESDILSATAGAYMAKFQVVTFADFDFIIPAEYEDLQNTAIAILMEDVQLYGTGTVCVQGHITNPEWNWQTVGAPLWIHAAGQLTESDPHLVNPLAFPQGKAPVARVITPTSIIFDQGLGVKGDKGDTGSIDVPVATELESGIVRLSLAAIDSADPVVVGDNDPRNSNARVPLPHVQASTTITTVPVGYLTGTTLDVQIAELEAHKLDKVGGTMTGPLYLYADPTQNLEAATKQYVDDRFDIETLDDLTDVTITTPTIGQSLTYTGTQWVNTTVPFPYLDNLQDVTLTSPSAGQSLVFSGGVWINATPVAALDDLTDVTLTTPSLGQVLTYNGTQWVNQAAAGEVMSVNGHTGVVVLGAADVGAVSSVVAIGAGHTLINDDGTTDTIAKIKSIIVGPTITLTETADDITLDVSALGQGIPDAPNDGIVYGRKDLQWFSLANIAPVQAVNSKVGNVQITGGTGVTIDNSGSGIIINVAGTGVSSVNAKTGAVNIVGGSNVVVDNTGANIVLSVPNSVGSVEAVGSGHTLINDNGTTDTIAKIKSVIAGPTITITETATDITLNVSALGQGIPDAPNDGVVYGRKDLQWFSLANIAPVQAVNSKVGNVQITGGTGVTIDNSGSGIVISASGAVSSVNSKVGAVNIVGGTNITVDNTGANIVLNVPPSVEEAPLDSKKYVRLNGTWTEATYVQSVSGGSPTLPAVSLVSSDNTAGVVTLKTIEPGTGISFSGSSSNVIINSTAITTSVDNVGLGTFQLVVTGNPPGTAQIKTLSAGVGILLSEASGVITISNTGGGGGGGLVQSVNGIAPNPITGDVLITAADVGALSVGGGTLSGPLEMSNNKITGLADATNAQDAVNLQTMSTFVFDSGIYA